MLSNLILTVCKLDLPDFLLASHDCVTRLLCYQQSDSIFQYQQSCDIYFCQSRMNSINIRLLIKNNNELKIN